MGDTRALTASHLDLFTKKCLTFGDQSTYSVNSLCQFLSQRKFIAALQQKKGSFDLKNQTSFNLKNQKFKHKLKVYHNSKYFPFCSSNLFWSKTGQIAHILLLLVKCTKHCQCVTLTLLR